MKIVLTGSLGHISKPLTQILVQKGHFVTVISSNTERKNEIEALGATAAIGSIEDVDFLAAIFKAADILYCMIPPNSYFNPDLDLRIYYRKIANNYAKAIQESGVKRIVQLSTIGAHTDKGNGILAYGYDVENILKQLPPDISIKFMRPVGFYYNMFAYIPTIKTQNAIVQNYGGDEKEPWVSPLDIAAVISEEMEKPFEDRTIRYIASDEASPNEVAQILGEAIGKPGLIWLEISDEQMLNSMTAAGMNPGIAKGLVEMNAGRRSDVLYEDYKQHKPTLGKVKLKDFAIEFIEVFNNK